MFDLTERESLCLVSYLLSLTFYQIISVIICEQLNEIRYDIILLIFILSILYTYTDINQISTFNFPARNDIYYRNNGMGKFIARFVIILILSPLGILFGLSLGL